MISNDASCNVQGRSDSPERSTLKLVTAHPDCHGSASDQLVARQASITATPQPFPLHVFTSSAQLNAPWASATLLMPGNG